MPEPLIKVQFDTSQFFGDMKRLAEQEIPFAFALALTRIGSLARKDVRGELPSAFTLRNQFVSQSIRIDPEKVQKGAMQVTIGARNANGNKLLELEATGGEGHGKSGKEIAIPTDHVRPDHAQLVPRFLKPKAILGKKSIFGGSAFIHESKSGKRGIVVRVGNGKDAELLTLYALRETVKIPAIWPFWREVDDVVKREWQRVAAAALDRAIKSRK